MEEFWDVVQIVFVKIWEKCFFYDLKWSLNIWIYCIVMNLVIDYLWFQCSCDCIVEFFCLYFEYVVVGVLLMVCCSGECEIDGIFGEFVEVFIEKQWVIFVLCEFEGLLFVEVLEIVGCKELIVCNYLFNVCKFLWVVFVECYLEYLLCVWCVEELY